MKTNKFREIGIVTLIKNEQQYLEDWIKYHLDLGIDYIEIYEDIDSVSHYNITSKYENVTLKKLPNKFHKCNHRQYSLFKYVDSTKKHGYTLYIDIDEFLTFAEGYSIEDLRKANRSLLLHYKYYTADIIDRPLGNSYREIYTEETNLGRGQNEYKPLVFNPEFTTFANVHCVSNAKLYLGINGEFNNSETYNIYLRHYYSKSLWDWKQKIAKGNFCPEVFTEDQWYALHPNIVK